MDPVLFVHLLQNIHLMVLPGGSLSGGSSFELGILLSDSRFDMLSFLSLEPLKFGLLLLLANDVLVSGFIDVLKKVNLGLLLSGPLSLSHLVLSFGFLLNKLIDKLLVSLLVVLGLFVVFLKLNDLLSPLILLSLLSFSDGSLPGEGSIEKLLVSVLLGLLLDLSELSLSSIVINEFEVSLSVQDELLSNSLFVSFKLLSPLSLEHLLLSSSLFSLDVSGTPPCLSLPVEDIDGFVDSLSLILSLSLLSLNFLVMIHHPELGIDLLLNDALLELCLLVHELLFSLDVASGGHELGLFSPEVVSFHLKLPVESLLDLHLSLLFSLGFEGVQALGHLSPNLLRSLKVLHELSFVLLVFCSQQSSKLRLPQVEIGSLPSLDVINSVSDQVLLDHIVGLSLPPSLQIEVLVASDRVVELLLSLYIS